MWSKNGTLSSSLWGQTKRSNIGQNRKLYHVRGNNYIVKLWQSNCTLFKLVLISCLLYYTQHFSVSNPFPAVVLSALRLSNKYRSPRSLLDSASDSCGFGALWK